MRERRVRTLFLRYRERGDVEALADVFTATAPGLLGLARHLVARAEDAEDVLQATFLAAIENAGRFDSSQDLRPWLAGILVRKARQARDRAARRVDPERVPERVEPGPDEVASGTELASELTEALASLPPSYRDVLHPFLRDGDRPQEIAQRAGLAAGTVRVRIHRGLKLLRKALPVGFAASAGAQAVSTAGIERVRGEVLRAARTAVRSGPLAAATVGATTVTSFTGLRAAAGVAAVALAGAGIWRLAAPASREDAGSAVDAPQVALAPGNSPRELEGPPAPSVLEGPAAGSGSERAAAPGPEVVSPPTESASAAAWTLVADVSGFDGTPYGDLRLRISWGEGDPLEVPITQDGPLPVPLVELDLELDVGADELPSLELAVQHTVYEPFARQTSRTDVTGPGTISVAVPLVRACSLLTGRVTTSSSAAAIVGFFPDTGDPERPAGRPISTTCGEDGAFRLFVPHETGWFAAVAEGCAPEGGPILLVGREELDLGTIELGPGADIAGLATGANGAPESGRVVAQSLASQEGTRVSLRGTGLTLLEESVVSAGGEGRTDEQGEFRIGALTPGTYDVLFVPDRRVSGTYDPHGDGTRVEAPVENLVLESRIRVYTLRILCDGLPVNDAMVRYNLDGGSVAGSTEARGTYPFFMAHNDERYRVEVWKPGYESVELQLGPRDFDEDGGLDVELERVGETSDLVLDLVPKHGPVGRLRLRMTYDGSDWYVYRGAQRVDGALRMPDMPDGRYRLQLWPEVDEGLPPTEQSQWLPPELDVTCAGPAPTRVRVDLRPGGRATLFVTGLEGDGPRSWWLEGPGDRGALQLLSWDPIEERAASVYAYELAADGTYGLAEALAPGEYTLEVGLEGGTRRSFPFPVSAGLATDVRVEL